MGAIAILVGLFAYPLGLDNNIIMGPKRKILIGIGIILIFLHPVVIGILSLSRRWHLSKKWGVFWQKLARTRLGILLNQSIQPGDDQSEKFTWIWAISASLFVTLFAAWLLTAGTMTHWTPFSQYFDNQANGFLSGQLSLSEEPPAELAQLTDVYNWHEREGISYIWDASYFKGKYYLYWGPVPALLAAGIKLIKPCVVEDQVLLLIFFSGLAFTFGAFFCSLHKFYFRSSPRWTVFLFTLVCGLAAPALYLINRPSVYETAIASAQFFLLLGIYGIVRALNESPNKRGWFLLAGFGLGASFASRFSYAPTIALISLIIGIQLVRNMRYKLHNIIPLLLYGVPLLIFVAGIFWFNHARFENIFESGIRYQLTGDAIPDDFHMIYSLGYIGPNLYSDLIRPFHITPGAFPFLTTPFIFDQMWPNYIHRSPTYYSGEPVVGILVSIPFLWLLILLPVRWITRFIRWINEIPSTFYKPEQERLPVWFTCLLVGTTLTQMLMSFSFVMTTMRYLSDFTPLLLLCTSILVWSTYERIRFPAVQKILLFLLIILCLASLLISFLMNMQAGSHRFELNNPILFGKIAMFFESFW